ncbi:Amino acid permease family protein [Dirofilaria immitis]|nr:Amino acid permease family protein [Dirofilaria immitis]
MEDMTRLNTCKNIALEGRNGKRYHSRFWFYNGLFVGWTYWVISWVSTTALVIVGVDYLTPFFYEDVQSAEIGLTLISRSRANKLKLDGNKKLSGLFVDWTYWVISCVITTALVIVGVDYLTPFFMKTFKVCGCF